MLQIRDRLLDSVTLLGWQSCSQVAQSLQRLIDVAMPEPRPMQVQLIVSFSRRGRSANNGAKPTGMRTGKPTRSGSSASLRATEKLTLAHLEQTACALHEAALGAIPEDEALNTRSRKPLSDGLRVGPLTVLWHEGVLSVRTPTEHHILSGREAAELLSYLYGQRGSLLKQRR